MPRLTTVMLDVDDVIADFEGAALDALGIKDPGRRSTWCMQTWLGMDERDFWKPIELLGDAFWSEMPMLPGAAEFVGYLSGMVEKLVFVTACFEPGRVQWLKRHFTGIHAGVVMTDDKAQFARPFAMLVDDKIEHCEAFAGAGGRAMLFSRRYNSDMARDDVISSYNKILDAVEFIRSASPV